ncbi:hypothetical protein CC80DRAFT_597658 [Byssothecium circinans]|uniref:F-box domain-containing protein n=1 Tax=Byssothecium circinans TaxID=147558 RepID=A0A6A5TF99_9PLEO|nr:hypothetical protein CC80DRAFT_597658 [Byssothecium circinans]
MAHISDLPNELLASCIEYCQDEKSDIRALRLVSQRFHGLSSPYLITEFTVYLSEASFTHLYTLSTHQILRKYVTSLTINVSCYEATCADSLKEFTELASDQLRWFRAFKDKGEDTDEEEDATQEGWDHRLHIIDQWDQLLEESLANIPDILHLLSEPKRILYHAWIDYGRKYREQQALMGEDSGRRLIDMMERLSGLQTLLINEEGRAEGPIMVISEGGTSYISYPWLQGHFLRNLVEESTSNKYNSSIRMERSGQHPLPAMYIFRSLFGALAVSSVTLQEIIIEVPMPIHLRPFHLSADEKNAIRKSVASASTLSLAIDGWFFENLRPSSEYTKLSPLISSFFSSLKARKMTIEFPTYFFGEMGLFSLSDIVDIRQVSRPTLQVLELISVPVTFNDVGNLVDCVNVSLRVLYATFIVVGQAQWCDILDVLRKLERLESLGLVFRAGEGYGNDGVKKLRPIFNLPMELIEDYVMKRTDANPLVGGRVVGKGPGNQWVHDEEVEAT